MQSISSTDDFYSLIESTKGITEDDHITKITQQLSKMSDQSIINFEKYFRKELIRVYNYNILLLFELSYPRAEIIKDGKPFEFPGDPYFSTDGFIYFRCGILLLGKNAVGQLLEDPNNFMRIHAASPSVDGEGMLYCTSNAFKEKNSRIDIESFLDPADHYDTGKFNMSGKRIKWYVPEEQFPELVKFFNYKRPIMQLPNTN